MVMRKFFSAIFALLIIAAPTPGAAFWHGTNAPQKSTNLAGATSNFEFNNVANNYWLGATYYSTEAAWLTATGCVKVGITYSCGGYVAPATPDQITNGSFGSGTTGWTADNSTLAVVGGEMEVSASVATSPGFYQDFTTTAGQAYLFSGTARRGTIQSGTSVGISYWSGAGTTFIGQVTTTNNTTTPLSAVVGADAASMRMEGRAIGSGKTGTAYYDNFSVKAALPYNGFTQGSYSGFVSGVTPASISATQAVTILGGDSSNNRLRMEYRTDRSLWITVNTYSGTGVANLNLGTVALNTAFTAHYSAAQDSIFGLLVGGFTQYDGTGAVPATGVIRYGFSPSGETWTGTITSAAVFGVPDLPLNAMVTTGDSYMVGSDATNKMNDHLVSVGRSGIFGGGGGWTVDQELAQLQSQPSVSKNMILGWWDGSANGVNTLGDIPAYIATMQQGIDGQNYQKFIISPEIKAPGIPANWTRSDAVRDAMVAQWGTAHVVDWRSILTTDVNGAVERQWLAFIVATAITAGQDSVIQTVGSTDFTTIGAPNNNVGTRFTATGPATGTGTITGYAEGHLNSAAMDLMAAAWSAKITANGWDNLYGAQLNWLLKRDIDPASNDNNPMWLQKAA